MTFKLTLKERLYMKTKVIAVFPYPGLLYVRNTTWSSICDTLLSILSISNNDCQAAILDFTSNLKWPKSWLRHVEVIFWVSRWCYEPFLRNCTKMLPFTYNGEKRKTAASRPSWIFFKFWNDGHHPRDIGKHHVKFQNASVNGLRDLRVNGRTHGRTHGSDSKVSLQ